MANQPIFVAAYRQNYVTLVAARANEAQDLFTPGASGTRLHAIALANDGEVPALVEFGAYAVVGGDVEVDIAPGTAPDTDPFTVTRAAGAWPALETGLVLTLSKGAVANRGDYKLRARTDTVFTRIDLDALHALDAVWQSRGDRFDAVFDQGLTVWFGSRVVYLPAYASGIRWLRSIVWGIATVAIATMALGLIVGVS